MEREVWRGRGGEGEGCGEGRSECVEVLELILEGTV